MSRIFFLAYLSQEEKAARERQIEEATRHAVDVPFNVMKLSLGSPLFLSLSLSPFFSLFSFLFLSFFLSELYLDFLSHVLAYTHSHTNTHIHTHIHTLTHTHSHTHTHTHTRLHTRLHTRRGYGSCKGDGDIRQSQLSDGCGRGSFGRTLCCFGCVWGGGIVYFVFL